MKKNVLFLTATLFLTYNVALSQSYSTATGTGALASLSTGDANTATGYQSMYYTSTPWNNSAHGMQSMYFNNTGYNNCAYGSLSMFYNSTGYENTALGYQSLSSNTAGIRNTAIGAYALFSTDNTGLNTGVGYRALYNNISGNFNTALGDNTGSNCTASYNTYIGSGADANSTGYINSTAIGSNTIVTGSYMIRFGDNNVTSIGGPVAWTNFSDKRIKKNIQNNVPGMAFIKLLRPVTYHFDLDALDAIVQAPAKTDAKGNPISLTEEQKRSRENKQAIQYSGFLAQEVEAAAQSINYDFSGVDRPKNNHDLYGLRYAEFVVPLVKAAQELSSTQDSLENEINSLEASVTEALHDLADLQKTLTTGLSTTGIQNQKTGVIAEQTGSYLEQNTPNPASGQTYITYHIEGAAKKAQLFVASQTGQPVRQIDLSVRKYGTVTLRTGELISGTYVYSLIIDGKTMDTKKLIIIR